MSSSTRPRSACGPPPSPRTHGTGPSAGRMQGHMRQFLGILKFLKIFANLDETWHMEKLEEHLTNPAVDC